MHCSRYVCWRLRSTIKNPPLGDSICETGAGRRRSLPARSHGQEVENCQDMVRFFEPPETKVHGTSAWSIWHRQHKIKRVERLHSQGQLWTKAPPLRGALVSTVVLPCFPFLGCGCFSLSPSGSIGDHLANTLERPTTRAKRSRFSSPIFCRIYLPCACRKGAPQRDETETVPLNV